MTDDRIAALERRVRALEDQLAICQLIATYGPAVDSESAEAVGELRIDGSWQVIRRTNRLPDGTPEARRLLTPPGR